MNYIISTSKQALAYIDRNMPRLSGSRKQLTERMYFLLNLGSSKELNSLLELETVTVVTYMWLVFCLLVNFSMFISHMLYVCSLQFSDG